MKFLTIAVLALTANVSAIKLDHGHRHRLHPFEPCTNCGPTPSNPRKTYPDPFAKGPLPKPSPDSPACSDPYKTDLYAPFEYKPQCMTPPIPMNIQSCPIDERKVL